MARTGRPKIVIDLQEAEKLGRLQCTLEECSAWMGIKLSTLSMRRDFLEAYKKGKEQGKISLRRILWQNAAKHPATAIFVSKNYLGLSDSGLQGDNVGEKQPVIAVLENVSMEDI